MVRAKKLVFAKKFEGLPKVNDFELLEEDLPNLKDGEILVEAIYLSVDPYMRMYVDMYKIGSTMIGSQIAKVLESKNSSVKVGDLVCGYLGWRSHTVFNPDNVAGSLIPTYVLPDFGSLPSSLGLGLLGMPGLTAYFGFLEVCKPVAGNVVVVSGAAGAVGTTVGQIAKIQGCKVIGICGSDEKCKWITNELGFDHAINYKDIGAVERDLDRYAADGIDCYFDNVGGDISAAVIKRMNTFGHISVCGAICAYNTVPADWPSSLILQPFIVMKQLKMEGFIVSRFWNKWFDGLEQLKSWTQEGKLKYRETVTNGFENVPQALIDMLEGKNFGKAIVKV